MISPNQGLIESNASLLINVTLKSINQSKIISKSFIKTIDIYKTQIIKDKI